MEGGNDDNDDENQALNRKAKKLFSFEVRHFKRAASTRFAKGFLSFIFPVFQTIMIEGLPESVPPSVELIPVGKILSVIDSTLVVQSSLVKAL